MRRQHHGQSPGPRLVIAIIIDRDAHRDSGIVDDDIEAAEMRCDIVDDGCDVIAAGNVERPGRAGSTARCDLSRDGLRAFGRIVGHRDVGALGCEYPRRGDPCRWPRR
jgi:hypothetical protein